MKTILWLFVSLAVVQASTASTQGAISDELDSLLRELSDDQIEGLSEALLEATEKEVSLKTEDEDDYDWDEDYYDEERELWDYDYDQERGLWDKEEYEEEMPLFSEVADELIEQSVKARAIASVFENRNVKEQSGPMKKLEKYLSSKPSIAARSRTALAHLDAIRAYRRELESRRGGPIDNEEFLKTIQKSYRLDEDLGETKTLEEKQQQFDRIATLNRNADAELDLEHIPEGVCVRQNINCNHLRNRNRFRTFDGTCNNLGIQNPERRAWGSAKRAMKRRLPQAYEDGLHTPRRKRQNGINLPSARRVSFTISRRSRIRADDLDARNSMTNSLLLMQFGQFLDHDIAETPMFQGQDCTRCRIVNEQCFPIRLERNHPLGVRCIPFARSEIAQVDSCDIPFFEQFNGITSYLDASMVYGSSLEEVREISAISSTRGRMAVIVNPVTNNRADLLLPIDEEEPLCRGPMGNDPDRENCFKAGDIRVNEQPGLASMHTLWVRFHNHIEENLRMVNRGWNGVRLFQESRRILIAIWQAIAIDEYLLLILGATEFNKRGLRANNAYNDSVDATMANVVAAAAFRFGHSEIPDTLPFTNLEFNQEVPTNLDDQFFNPDNLFVCPVDTRISGVDSLTAGFSSNPSENLDSFFAPTIRNNLFGGGGGRPGFDLIALNIQRARDHGIPGYAAALEHCGLEVSKKHLRRELITPLFNLYGNEDANAGVNDANTLANIDIFAGAMSEIPVEDGFLGPTFTCLIGEQFKELTQGDRFFFRSQESQFTEMQREAIAAFRLANFLCLTLNDLPEIQERPFLLPWVGRLVDSHPDSPLIRTIGPFATNEIKQCSEFADLDYSLFRE